MKLLEYTIKEFGKLTGVTTRTLRYYDEIGLLLPKRINHSGYRIYGASEVEKLQHILFLRELEIPLKQIQQQLNAKNIQYLTLLKEHQVALKQKQEHITKLLHLIEQSIGEKEGENKMSDIQKFEAFKQKKLMENEEKYGDEIREKYGKERVEQSNAKFLNMTKEEHERMQKIEQQLFELLKNHREMSIPSEEAEKMFNLHKTWLTQAWGNYNAEAHKGVAQMYIDVPEFTAYYEEKADEGAIQVLRDVIHYYA